MGSDFLCGTLGGQTAAFLGASLVFKNFFHLRKINWKMGYLVP
jgi:hypothetical protein